MEINTAKFESTSFSLATWIGLIMFFCFFVLFFIFDYFFAQNQPFLEFVAIATFSAGILCIILSLFLIKTIVITENELAVGPPLCKRSYKLNQIKAMYITQSKIQRLMKTKRKTISLEMTGSKKKITFPCNQAQFLALRAILDTKVEDIGTQFRDQKDSAEQDVNLRVGAELPTITNVLLRLETVEARVWSIFWGGYIMLNSIFYDKSSNRGLFFTTAGCLIIAMMVVRYMRREERAKQIILTEEKMIHVAGSKSVIKHVFPVHSIKRVYLKHGKWFSKFFGSGTLLIETDAGQTPIKGYADLHKLKMMIDLIQKKNVQQS